MDARGKDSIRTISIPSENLISVPVAKGQKSDLKKSLCLLQRWGKQRNHLFLLQKKASHVHGAGQTKTENQHRTLLI